VRKQEIVLHLTQHWLVAVAAILVSGIESGWWGERVNRQRSLRSLWAVAMLPVSVRFAHGQWAAVNGQLGNGDWW